MLEHYIVRRRNKQNVKIGYLVAHNMFGAVQVGFSLCSTADKFSKPLAWDIADGRCEKQWNLLPPSIVDDVEVFLGRCVRYFKDCNVFPVLEDKDDDGNYYLVNI